MSRIFRYFSKNSMVIILFIIVGFYQSFLIQYKMSETLLKNASSVPQYSCYIQRDDGIGTDMGKFSQLLEENQINGYRIRLFPGIVFYDDFETILRAVSLNSTREDTMLVYLAKDAEKNISQYELDQQQIFIGGYAYDIGGRFSSDILTDIVILDARHLKSTTNFQQTTFEFISIRPCQTLTSILADVGLELNSGNDGASDDNNQHIFFSRYLEQVQMLIVASVSITCIIYSILFVEKQKYYIAIKSMLGQKQGVFVRQFALCTLMNMSFGIILPITTLRLNIFSPVFWSYFLLYYGLTYALFLSIITGMSIVEIRRLNIVHILKRGRD